MGRSSFCFTLFTHKVLKYLQTLGFIVYTVPVSCALPGAVALSERDGGCAPRLCQKTTVWGVPNP
jgi:hypothetical protein